jgi:hypothetical protein
MKTKFRGCAGAAAAAAQDARNRRRLRRVAGKFPVYQIVRRRAT